METCVYCGNDSGDEDDIQWIFEHLDDGDPVCSECWEKRGYGSTKVVDQLRAQLAEAKEEHARQMQENMMLAKRLAETEAQLAAAHKTLALLKPTPEQIEQRYAAMSNRLDALANIESELLELIPEEQREFAAKLADAEISKPLEPGSSLIGDVASVVRMLEERLAAANERAETAERLLERIRDGWVDYGSNDGVAYTLIDGVSLDEINAHLKGGK